MKHPDDPHRFLHYSPTLDAGARRCELTGDEHHHATRVLRLRTRDLTFVTDGRGLIAECVVESIADGKMTLAVRRPLETSASRPEVTLALAVVKKDAFERVTRQCAELGVRHFIPYGAEKSQLRGYSRRFLERLRKIATEAMKQSFRAWLPTIEEVRTFDELVADLDRYDRVLLGDPDGPPLAATAAGTILVVVGPEAGLTRAETDRLREAGCTPAACGKGRLRVETAAAALVACLCARPEV